jgi:hypothetical protein
VEECNSLCSVRLIGAEQIHQQGGYRRWQKRMADYHALISEGIAALDIKTSEARREYYGRARATRLAIF